MGKRRLNPTKELELRLREERVIDLKSQGYTYRQIEQVLRAEGANVSYTTLSRDMQRVLSRRTQEVDDKAAYYRVLMMERAELMLRRIYPKMATGNLEAARAWLNCLNFMARLYGLYKSRGKDRTKRGDHRAPNKSLIGVEADEL